MIVDRSIDEVETSIVCRVIFEAVCARRGYLSIHQHQVNAQLKEYYEIVDEAHPLSGFFPTHAVFFTEMHF